MDDVKYLAYATNIKFERQILHPRERRVNVGSTVVVISLKDNLEMFTNNVPFCVEGTEFILSQPNFGWEKLNLAYVAYVFSKEFCRFLSYSIHQVFFSSFLKLFHNFSSIKTF